MINLLTSPQANAQVREPSVKPPFNHSSERSPDRLNLLVPWDIPLTCQLSESVKRQIEESLRSLLKILNNPNLTQAHQQLNEILTILPTPNTQLAQIKSTKTALSTAAVEDYDIYFGINHVQTNTDDSTALCLTQALLINCYKFLLLCNNTPNLSPQQIIQQKQGFISYIHLLTRVFNIDALSQ